MEEVLNRYVEKLALWPTELSDGYVAWLEKYLAHQHKVNGEWITVHTYRKIT